MTEYESIKALNWSSLKHMSESPLMYQWRQSHPRADTPALLLGRAIHCAVFEPAAFEGRYVCATGKPCSATTKAGRACSNSALPLSTCCGVHGGAADADVYRLAHPDVEVLTADQAEVVRRCVESVRGHADAAALLEGQRVEQTVTWTDPETGVLCKGRFDSVGRRRLVDIKSNRGLGRFPRDASALLYHGQLAWYLAGGIAAGMLDEDATAHIVTPETVEPYDCAALDVAGADLEAGHTLWRRLLNEWVSCRESGVWYGRYPVRTRLELPRWAPGMELDEEVL